MSPVDLTEVAVRYGGAGWPVFPLAPRSKVPAIPGSAGGRGMLDASTDPDTIRRWWRADPRRNIGGRVPIGLFVLDVDPRHGGDENLTRLIRDHGGDWSRTLTTVTGGGGWHLVYDHPGGDLSQDRLPAGLDLKTSTGYVVMPGSVHPNGASYRWAEPRRPIAPAVPWLVELLRPLDPLPSIPAPRPAPPSTWTTSAPSVADWFTAARRWADVLVGWRLVRGDGESDGSRWRHLTATAPYSATVKYGLLFCFSPNAGLPVTEPGRARGLTRFAAWAHLEHGGDLSAAARAARQLRGGWAA